ncbi:MAG: methyltransferase domain-containing protein [Mycobacterium sp.]|nr:methyltransferase domain-containing protein [Mycobacterium sp.]
MAETPVRQLEPHFGDIQHHYDLSDDFYGLFLDPSRTYSCAYFDRSDMTLEEAQSAKIDLALGKLGLRSGMTLLDIGCGWGSTMVRALRDYDVNVIGLTLSRNQARHVRALLANDPSPRSKRVLLRGWEQFDEPVDRIVTIGAFEHFGRDRYSRFFQMAKAVLPSDGVMLLHSIVRPSNEDYAERNLPIRMRHVRFMKFIQTEIFPGGDLPQPQDIADHAAAAGFALQRTQSLRMHYARTLQCWAANLEDNREQALAIQPREVYERYLRYLSGCVEPFREGYIDVCQFTLVQTG